MSIFPTIAVLGRQPPLGIAELESLYGAETVQPFGKHGCLVNLPADQMDFNRLGGSTRIGSVLTILDSTKWGDITKELELQTLRVADKTDGKLSFGVSTFGVPIAAGKLAQSALKIKKAVKQTGHSVRMVPHKELSLGAAVVLNNKLHRGGLELLAIANGKQTIIARTDRIQDIDSYTARDRERPMRDAKVGMLPPKLAQIIINLSIGQSSGTRRWEVGSGDKHRTDEAEKANPQLQNPVPNIRILDPFCGTGVLLQEATLMNYDIHGTDLEPRMVQYTIANLEWLDKKYPEARDYRRVEIGDATTHTWNDPSAITNVAAETYLGQPLSRLPNGEHLSKIMHEVNSLHHKFLRNLASQITPGTRICLAVPTWRGLREFLHLSALDYLDDLGYTRVRFEYADSQDLIYHRENQVVGRELLVLIKN